MLRALLAEASPLDRIITIELSYELGLHELTDRHPDCPAWETREANTEGEGAITMDQTRPASQPAQMPTGDSWERSLATRSCRCSTP